MLLKERSDMMKKRKSKHSEDDEIPKALRNMKKNNKDKNSENIKKTKNKKNKFKKVIISLIIIVILILGISLGISANTWKKLSVEMVKNESSTVVDKDGQTIAKLGDERKKKNVTSEEIPKNLKNAYISIEDERFYKHSGVDTKRTASAIFSYVIHFGSSSFGGSTITQQLVKNITGDSTDSITRKVKEWWKAWILETALSKDEIITSYLNVIYTGPSIYGVENGAKYYFNKSVSDLDIAECAFLAGINHSPNSYNPFGDKDNADKIKTRTKTVLSKMKELKYISDDEYNSAIQEVENGLKFKNGEVTAISDGVYSYHTDAMITEIANDIKNKYIIDAIKGKERSARFVCAMALVIPDKEPIIIEETMEGLINDKIEGENGFGYDPIFYFPPCKMTSAMMPMEEKNKYSHRAKALKKLYSILKEML